MSNSPSITQKVAVDSHGNGPPLTDDKTKPPFAPTRVEVQIVLNDVGKMDLIEGSLDVQLEISMNWVDPRIKSATEAADDPTIWRPNLNIFNRCLDAVVTKPTLFFKDGVCGHDLTYTGKVLFKPGDAIAKFPFDCVKVNILIDGCDDYLHDGVLDLRLAPDESIHKLAFGPQEGGQKVFKLTEHFDPGQLEEWTLSHMELKEFQTRWSRTYKRIGLCLVMQRDPTYYFFKIVLVVTLISILAALGLTLDPVKDYAVRLSFAATMFVATTTFLFVIHSDLPKTAHIHAVDKLMLVAFAAQFFTGLITAAQILIMRVSSKTEYFGVMDTVAGTLVSLLILQPLIKFWIPQVFFMRSKKLTSEDLSLQCRSRSEPYGVCISVGSS